MSDRPQPLVPADCDLRKLDWFPLYYKRLLDSDWWAGASDTAKARSVDLWAKAFQEVPAASLPDHDGKLARLCGLDPHSTAWRKHKAEILAPWVLCADGRWYHPTLSEVALKAWEGLVKTRKSALERVQRMRQRQRERYGVTGGSKTVTPEPANGAVLRSGGPLLRRKSGVEDIELPSRSSNEPLDGGVGEGDLFFLDEPVTPLPAKPAKPKPPKPAKPPAPPPPIDAAFAAYLGLAERCGLAKPKSLDEDRRKRIAARLKDGGLEGWTEALAAVERNRWAQGAGPRGWKADLDFIVQLKSFRRLREGYYDQFDTGNERGQPPATGADRRRRDRDENLGRAHAGALAAVERLRERG